MLSKKGSYKLAIRCQHEYTLLDKNDGTYHHTALRTITKGSKWFTELAYREDCRLFARLTQQLRCKASAIESSMACNKCIIILIGCVTVQARSVQ